MLEPSEKYYKNLNSLLKSAEFSAEKWTLPKNPQEKLSVLMGAFQAIQRAELEGFHESSKDKESKKPVDRLKNLHACVVYITAEITATLKGIPEDTIDLGRFNRLFFELNQLIRSYKKHYPGITADRHIPLDDLLAALSEKLVHAPGESKKKTKTEGSKSLIAFNLADLLATWASCASLSSDERACSVRALGQFASKGQLRGCPINLSFLVTQFTATIKKAKGNTVVLWMQGLSDLDEAGLLKNTIPIGHINSALKRINSKQLSSEQVCDFLAALAGFFKNWTISDPNLLAYPQVEKILSEAIVGADSFDVGRMSHSLFVILDALEPQVKPAFTVVDQLFSQMAVSNQSVLPVKSSDYVRQAISISKTIHFSGEIVKIREPLYAEMSERTEKQIANLFAALNKIVVDFMQLHKGKTEFEQTRSDIFTIINSVVLALYGSALLGISTPCTNSRKLANGMCVYLEKHSGRFENYSILVNQFALYMYLTRSSKEQPLPWLKAAILKNKPKLPELKKVHGQVIALLRGRDCAVEPEFLFDECPFPIDIYCKPDGKDRWVEIDRWSDHFKDHHRGHPKDRYKDKLIEFKEGKRIRHYRRETPQQMLDALYSPDKPQQEIKLSSDMPFYRYRGNDFRKGSTPPIEPPHEIVKTDKPEPAATLNSKSMEPEPSLLGDDLQDTGLVSKRKKHKSKIVSKTKTAGKKKKPVSEKVQGLSTDKEELKTTSKLRSSHFTEIGSKFYSANEMLEKYKHIPPHVILRKAEEGHVLAQHVSGCMIFRNKTIPPAVRFSESIYWYRKASDQKFLPSQTMLGMMYWSGKGVEKNNAEAIRLFTLGAEQGYAPAQFQLGWMYYEGHGVKKDVRQALHFFNLAADQGYAQAQYIAGDIYKKGRDGIEQDINRARYLYELSAEQGFHLAQFDLANLYQKYFQTEETLKLAFNLYRLVARRGDIEARFCMGVCYQNGDGVGLDVEKAKKLYQLGAQEGHTLSIQKLEQLKEQLENARKERKERPQNLRKLKKINVDELVALGRKSLNGQGVPQDFKKAVYYFRMGVEENDKKAQHYLACMLLEGQGIDKNIPEAIRLFKLASDQNYDLASRNLGNIYLAGKEVPRDPEQAAHFFELGATLGDDESQFNLATMHRIGDGVAKDLKRAASLYKDAAKQGHLRAQYELACLLFKGVGGELNPKEALRLWEGCAEKNHTPALYILGNAFESGLDCFKPDLKKAAEYYRRAASLGHKNSAISLQALELKLKPQASSSAPSGLASTNFYMESTRTLSSLSAPVAKAAFPPLTPPIQIQRK